MVNFYIDIEIEKITALKSQAGDFDGLMTPSEAAKGDITWWIDNALGSKKKINDVHDILLQTDASLQELTGRWSPPDMDLFASRLNTQYQRYVAWRPDPNLLLLPFDVDRRHPLLHKLILMA